MNRGSTSDRLGAKGERRLGELLLDAGLEPVSPDRDRLGWDTVATWPLREDVPLDSRPAPLACHIQLKTVWAGGDRFKLNLATLENIVKDSRPAFVVVFEVEGADMSFVRARVIHVGGGFLAEILRRLRAAQVAGGTSSGLTYEPSVARWSVEVPSFTGAALRSTLEAFVPSGMGDYAVAKARQLAELGFERGALRLSATVQAASRDEFIDGFLGLGRLRVTSSKVTETRFGIEMERGDAMWPRAADAEGSSISLKPRRQDRCTVGVTRASDDARLELRGELFLVPTEVSGPGRYVLEIRTRLLRIRLDIRDEAAGPVAMITFASAPDVLEARAAAQDWREYFMFSEWAVREPIDLEIRPRRGSGPGMVRGVVDPGVDHAEADAYRRMSDAADAAGWVLLAAQAPGTPLTWAEIDAASADLTTIRAMKLAPETLEALTFASPTSTEAPDEGEREMLYAGRAPVGGWWIAFAARASVRSVREGASISWSARILRLEAVRKTKAREESFRDFLRDARRLTGLESVFGPDVGV